MGKWEIRKKKKRHSAEPDRDRKLDQRSSKERRKENLSALLLRCEESRGGLRGEKRREKLCA